MHYTTITTALLTALAAASPIANPEADAARPECGPNNTNPECAHPNQSFTSIALRSASPIHFLPLVIRDGGVHLGGKSSSYCPEGVDPKACPKGDRSVFSINGPQATAALDVIVPGGQQLYVRRNGALAYTVPHSAAIPKGAYTSGFGYFENTEGEVDTWNFTGAGGATGLLACPTGKKGDWEVFADVKGFSKKGCLGFSAEFSEAKGPGAFEYS